MKYLFCILFNIFGFTSFSQTPKDGSIIQGIINCFETKSLKETKTFILSNAYYLKDSSMDDQNSYTLLYKKTTGEAVGIKVTRNKIEIMSYLVPNKENYELVKSQILKLGFKGGKPYKNDDHGIIEEIDYVKSKTLVLASNREDEKGRGLIYDFLVTLNF